MRKGLKKKAMVVALIGTMAPLAGMAAEAAAGASASASADAVVDAAAAAASNSVAPQDKVDTVVVTARRTSERLQDVPLNLTALSSANLEQLHIESLRELTAFTPNLGYSNQGGLRTTQQINIRGLTGGSFGASKASVFLDGVYMPSGIDSVPFDLLERVEVLKGPQSAVYGRATFSGAINYVTRAPSDVLTGSLSTEISQDNSHNVHGYISGPINDKLGYQLTLSQKRAGIGLHNVDGASVGDQKTDTIGLKLRWKPLAELTVSPYFYRTLSRDGLPSDYAYLDPALRNGAFVKPNGTTAYYPVGALPSQDFNNRYHYVTSQFNSSGLTQSMNWTGVNTEYKLGDYTVKFNTSHAYTDANTQVDYGAQNTGYLATTLLPQIFYTKNSDKNNQAELRIESPKFGDFKFATGLYYLNLEKASYSKGWIGVGKCCSGSPSSFTWTSNGTVDKSIFGSVNYDISQQFVLTAEARYQQEDADASAMRIDGTHSSDYAATFNSFLPRVSLLYKATPNLNYYVTYSKGTTPGGFNANAQLPAGIARAYDEEKLDNFEVGAKGSWLNGKLSASVAAYHMKWKDMQTAATYYLPDLSNVAVTENRGTATVDGAEIELQAVPMAGLKLRAAAGYNKSKYGDFCSTNLGALLGRSDQAAPNTCVYVTGNHIERTPVASGSLSADYRFALNDEWQAYVGSDALYTGRIYTNETNLNWLTPTTVFNLRTGMNKGNLYYELFMNNVFDNSHPVAAVSQVDLPISTSSQYGQNVRLTPRAPRQFGARVTWSF